MTTTLRPFCAAVAALTLALPAAPTRAQAASFSVSPPSVEFGDQYVGSTFSLDVWLRNEGTAPVTLTVAACEGTSPAFSGYAGSYTIQPGAVRVFYLSYQAPLAAAHDTGCLLVASDDPTAPVVQVGVSGSAVTNPVLMGRRSLDFGRVLVGGWKSGTLGLLNPSPTDLVVSLEPCPGTSPAFALPQPFTIRAGGSASAYLSYAPTAAGVDSGCVVASAPGAESLTVSVTGMAMDPGAVLSLGSDTYQFGNVAIGAAEMRTLTVSNTGIADLVVTGLSPCPGSGAQFTWPTAGFTLAPGASRGVPVTVRPTASGWQSGCIAIASNDPLTPRATVTLAGDSESYAPYLLVSPSPLDFGAVPIGATATAVISVTALTSFEWPPVVAMRCPGTSSDFTVDYADLSLPAGASTTVTVHYRPSSAGTVQGCVQGYSEGGGRFFLSLRGTGQGVPRMAIAPPSYQFGTVVLGSTASASVTVSNPGTDTLWYAVSACPGTPFAMVALAYDLAPGASRAHPFSFKPQAAGPLPPYCLQFTSGQTGTIRVPFVGNVVTPPSLVLAPPSLAFGDVLVGSAATRFASVSNGGGASLLVSSIAPCPGASAAFRLVGPPSFAVAPGAGPTLAFAYEPTASGVDSGCFAFTSNDPVRPVQYLTSSGRGLLPPTTALTPPVLDFGDVLVGSTATQTITLSNAGEVDLVVSGIAPCSGADASFSAPATGFTVAPGAARSIPVAFAPASRGAPDGCFVISSNDPVGRGFAATGRGIAPALDAPSALDFGAVRRGTRNVLTLVVANRGERELVVSRVSRCEGTSREFSFEDDGFALAPGASRAVSVSYRPDWTGLDAGCLTLSSNDPAQATFTVALSGQVR